MTNLIQFEKQNGITLAKLETLSIPSDHETLCYIDPDYMGKGQAKTVYYAFIKGYSLEAVKEKIKSLLRDGKKNIQTYTWEEYEKIDELESGIEYKENIAQEVTKERFKEMLECLPPSRWENFGDSEIFKVIEAITGKLYSFGVRLGKGESARYFEVVANTSKSNREILSMVLNQALEATAQITA